jgi:hypothetical protein
LHVFCLVEDSDFTLWHLSCSVLQDSKSGFCVLNCSLWRTDERDLLGTPHLNIVAKCEHLALFAILSLVLHVVWQAVSRNNEFIGTAHHTTCRKNDAKLYQGGLRRHEVSDQDAHILFDLAFSGHYGCFAASDRVIVLLFGLLLLSDLALDGLVSNCGQQSSYDGVRVLRELKAALSWIRIWVFVI